MNSGFERPIKILKIYEFGTKKIKRR